MKINRKSAYISGTVIANIILVALVCAAFAAFHHPKLKSLTLNSSYGATVPDFKPVKGELISEGALNTAAARTTNSKYYGTRMGYHDTKAKDLVNWMEKNPPFRGDSPMQERTLVSPKLESIRIDNQDYSAVSQRCFATFRGNDYKVKDALWITVYESKNPKHTKHDSMVDAVKTSNSYGCPDPELESVKHLIGPKGGTTWADVAGKLLDTLAG